jgi:hypothetical protein
VKLLLADEEVTILREILCTADLAYEKFGPGGAPVTRREIAAFLARLDHTEDEA